MLRAVLAVRLWTLAVSLPPPASSWNGAPGFGGERLRQGRAVRAEQVEQGETAARRGGVIDRVVVGRAGEAGYGVRADHHVRVAGRGPEVADIQRVRAAVGGRDGQVGVDAVEVAGVGRGVGV